MNAVPPQNLQAEQSVLGAILLENEAIKPVRELLTADDFYRESHRAMFNAMVELLDRGQAIDAITLSDALRGRGVLETVGGPAYIAELAATVPTAANVAYYARIVREKAVLRRLVSIATDIASAAYEAPGDVGAFLERAEHRFVQACRGAGTEGGSGARPGFRLVNDYLAELKHRAKKRRLWGDLIREGEVSMGVGRAYAGKSTFACALSRALHSGQPFLDQRCERVKVGYMALERNGAVVAQLFEKWALNVPFLDEVPGHGVERLANFLEREIGRLGLEFVVVDHLQNLLKVRDSSDYSAVSNAIAPFSAVAKRTGCHLMLLHHQGKTERQGEIDVMGSEAYRAATDALLELKARDSGDSRRHFFRAVGRGGVELAQIRIVVDLASGEATAVDAREADVTDGIRAITTFMSTRDDWVTQEEIRKEAGGRIAGLVRALYEGVERKVFDRAGGGKRGDAHVYQLAGFSCSHPYTGTREQETENRQKPQQNARLFLVPKRSAEEGDGHGNREQETATVKPATDGEISGVQEPDDQDPASADALPRPWAKPAFEITSSSTGGERLEEGTL